MQLKIWFGIIIPVIIVIFLALLGSLNIGLTINKNYNTELTLDDIYSNGVKNTIQLGRVNVKNDNFMSNRYQLPSLVAFLVDDDGGKQSISPGTVQYSESKVGDTLLTNGEVVVAPPYYSYQSTFSDEIKSHSSKEVKIELLPGYDFTVKNGEQLLSDYGAYDKLVLVESRQKYDNYYFCSTQSSKDLDNGIKIALELKNNSS